MANISVNLKKPCGIHSKDIRDLLQELTQLDSMQANDNVVVQLPERDQVSDLALTLIWTKLRGL